MYDNIDTEKLINVLDKKEGELKDLRDVAKFASFRVEHAEMERVKAIKQISKKFTMEQKKTQEVVDKMEQMKLELKMMETSDTSVASIWKRKCIDLFEVCNTLKTENEDLRDKCQELITQGLKLSEILHGQVTDVGQSLDDVYQRNNLALPKLAQNQAQTQYGSQFKASGPISMGITSGGRGVTTANTGSTYPVRHIGDVTPARASVY